MADKSPLILAGGRCLAKTHSSPFRFRAIDQLEIDVPFHFRHAIGVASQVQFGYVMRMPVVKKFVLVTRVKWF